MTNSIYPGQFVWVEDYKVIVVSDEMPAYQKAKLFLIKLETEYRLTDYHSNYYEWPQRRYNENGQKLVDIYAEIIRDMIASL